jgi:hypothetical protein
MNKQATQSSYQQNMMLEEQFDESLQDSPEVDKRLAMFKKMRQELLQEESKTKEENQRQKMEELNKKIESLEKIKKEKSLKQRQLDEEQAKKEQ